MKALRFDHRDVRYRAAKAPSLMAPKEKAAVDGPILGLKDETATVRQHSARALGALGPFARDAVRSLKQRVEDSDADVRSKACQAIEQISMK